MYINLVPIMLIVTVIVGSGLPFDPIIIDERRTTLTGEFVLKSKAWPFIDCVGASVKSTVIEVEVPSPNPTNAIPE